MIIRILFGFGNTKPENRLLSSCSHPYVPDNFSSNGRVNCQTYFMKSWEFNLSPGNNCHIDNRGVEVSNYVINIYLKVIVGLRHFTWITWKNLSMRKEEKKWYWVSFRFLLKMGVYMLSFTASSNSWKILILVDSIATVSIATLWQAKFSGRIGEKFLFCLDFL